MPVNPATRDRHRNKKWWRNSKGAVLAMLVSASSAASSFLIFSSFTWDRDQLLGKYSMFLVDSDATKDEPADEADNTKTLLEQLNTQLKSSSIGVTLLGKDSAIHKGEAVSRRIDDEKQAPVPAIRVPGIEKEHSKNDKGKESMTSLRKLTNENKIIVASAPGMDEKENKSRSATVADSSLETGIQEGIKSNKPASFFKAIQEEIDNENWLERCKRYGPHMTPQRVDDTPKKRRIFYGGLIADESWELFEIMGTETHGIFEAMVFVESNRTQSFAPRRFQHNEATRQRLQQIFGTHRLEIRQYVNENPNLRGLFRENTQRDEILLAWKDMGMGPEDIGYIADVDETATRSFLRAAQTCPHVTPFAYEVHKCGLAGGRLKAIGKIYEGSPECVTKQRVCQKPDMILGACLEVIGNTTEHPLAERDGYKRKSGFGTGFGGEEKGSPEYQKNYAKISGDHYPLWNAADLRLLGGGTEFPNSCFHLHNWFHDYDKIRNKYSTYGHPVEEAMTMPIESIHDDLKLMAYCLRNLTDAPSRWGKQAEGENAKKFSEVQDYQRFEGGFMATRKPWPIYFHDEDYRRRKHDAGQAKLQEDENKRLAMLNPHQVAKEGLKQRFREIMRQAWKHELHGEAKLAEAAKKEAKKIDKELWEVFGDVASDGEKGKTP